jgi:hypothetical protein
MQRAFIFVVTVTSELHDCHIWTSWLSHLNFMTVTSELHDCHIRTSWLSHPNFMTVTSELHDCHIRTSWLSHPNFMTVTSELRDCHIWTSWLSHPNFMTVTSELHEDLHTAFLYLGYAVQFSCFILLLLFSRGIYMLTHFQMRIVCIYSVVVRHSLILGNCV